MWFKRKPKLKWQLVAVSKPGAYTAKNSVIPSFNITVKLFQRGEGSETERRWEVYDTQGKPVTMQPIQSVSIWAETGVWYRPEEPDHYVWKPSRRELKKKLLAELIAEDPDPQEKTT